MTEESLPRVLVNTLVTVDLLDEAGQSERMEFEIVADAAADFDRGLLGESTPLARALVGQDVGRTLPYSRGDIRSVRIVSVGPSQAQPTADAAEQRRQRTEEALHKVERTNADMFASSFSGKWGNYTTDEFQDDLGSPRRDQSSAGPATDQT